MLKTRKLSKAGIWGPSLLIVVTPNGLGSLVRSESPSKHQVTVNTAARQKKASADTAIFQSAGTMVVETKSHTDSQMAYAPIIPMNPAVEKFVKRYIKNNSEDLVVAKSRGEVYFKIIDSVFRKYGLPVELKYLAVIESQLNSQARSRVGARGPWQLMPATARELGLKVSRKHDERTYYYKSTVAAAKHLRDLYNDLGDWLLVIAAYNSGTGPVYHAIHKSGSRNFWKLQYFLPAETRGHVKKFIGTHYYFEDKGSVTTLTKAEMNEHLKAVSRYLAERNQASAEERSNTYAGPESNHPSAGRESIADAGNKRLKIARDK